MTESEITKRFKEVNAIMWNAWKDPTLFKLVGELAEGFEYLEDGQLPVVHDEVRDLLGACARKITDALDEVLKDVPPTPYAKLRAVELLAGNAVPWGIKIDLAFKMIRLSRELITVFERDKEDIIREVNEVEYYYGLEAGKKLLEQRNIENKNRLLAIRQDFDFEVTRILHHFNTAILMWGTREQRDVPSGELPEVTAPSKPLRMAKSRTMAERLDAVQGAREAFDTMLRIDGVMNDSGQCILRSRKGKGPIIAAWDAVVEHFGVEGYPKGAKGDEALSRDLMDYMPPLNIGMRPSKLRDTDKRSAYSKALASCHRYLRERPKRIIAAHSDTSE